MRTPWMIALFAGLVACGEKDGTTDDTSATDDSGEVDVFSSIVYLETPYVELNDAEVFACHTPGEAWLSQTPDESCVQDLPWGGQVEDFESGNEVPDATVQLFMDDSYGNGTPDTERVTDSNGDLTVGDSAKTCTPTAYATFADPNLNTTMLTIQSHNVWEPSYIEDVDLNSVSVTTYNLIPAVLGISVQSGMGIVAGTAYDCNGDPIEGVMIIGRTASGTYPPQSVKYFREEFPNRNQEGTSDDGLWVVVNLPPDDIVMEMWGWDGSDYVLLGSSTLTVVPDSINIASVYTGFEDGVVYPSECLAPCEG
ncbi:MAG: hypothetical protein H6741_11595 [Alphaproteobacteria bacterium]|nr:hypothetical protein [Alphaproteobacteria bacterium]